MGGRQARDLHADERGNTAIEYALIAAMVAVAALAGLRILGGGTHGLYDVLQAISTALAAG